MKKLFLFLAMAALWMGATAQTDAQLGKKWFEAEDYAKALPHLKRATAAGDVDSKVRLAWMVFLMQAPSYSMDRNHALTMLDECIAQGSTYAMERKGFCLYAMSVDTREERLKGFELIKKASDLGNGQASADLYKIYKEGIRSFATGEFYIEPSADSAFVYIRRAYDQGHLDGKAYVGYYTFEGSHGYDKDEAAGVALMEAAAAESQRFFAGDCPEPCYCLINYYKAQGQPAKAAPLTKLLHKYYPSRY